MFQVAVRLKYEREFYGCIIDCIKRGVSVRDDVTRSSPDTILKILNFSRGGVRERGGL